MMAQKRSRNQYEADNSLVFYGTPLPPLDPDVRDDGTYVPIWKQEVTDERGRKRFHGAFTGGFSAGYYNTVGSKEGWAPATFVSSRTNRHKNHKDQTKQRPEDFMDEEDIAEQEASKKLSTTDTFSGIGSTEHDALRRDALMDLMRPSTSIGVRLLEKMGWKEGQGIGPKIRRTVVNDADEMHWFAPSDTLLIKFDIKTDTKGLEYSTQQVEKGKHNQNMNEIQNENEHENENDSSILSRSKARFSDSTGPKKSSFGVGVLNDTGSDEDDPYAMGPKISYNRSLGSSKKSKKAKSGGVISSATTISRKPVFISKKKIADNLKKCNDGRLPLDGFILDPITLNPSMLTTSGLSEVPLGWISKKLGNKSADSDVYQSTVDAARASTLEPSTRSQLLGEMPLPGKSVFDYLSNDARTRLVIATNNPNLPIAGNEAPPAEYRKSLTEKTKEVWSKMATLDASIAKAALTRVDFMPYSDNLEKQNRYRAFLEHVIHSKEESPSKAEDHTIEEWEAELHEFVQAATVFRPVMGMMASRFTSSSAISGDTGDIGLSKPKEKANDPAEQAAQLGMFGSLTRSVTIFSPTRLLCKRFGVKPPENFEDIKTGQATSQVDTDMLKAMDRMEGSRDSQVGKGSTNYVTTTVTTTTSNEAINVETNEALEQDRPDEALFKAIFGD